MAGKMKPQKAGTQSAQKLRRTAGLIPVRSLGASHRQRILAHLLALDSKDRYLRFGFGAQDSHIEAYVKGLNFVRDDIFGIYSRRLVLIATAHLAYPEQPGLDSCAEFGVSVLKRYRGRGFGARLFERAATRARNKGVRQMFIHALSENTAMLHIARRAGAIVQRDGSDSEAHLLLPSATFDSRIGELLLEQMAEFDYRMKVQAQQFRDLLTVLQAARSMTDSDDALQVEGKPPNTDRDCKR